MEVVPHHLQEVIKVPLVMGGDGHGVRDTVDDVQLLYRDLVNLVQHIDGRNIYPVRGGHVILHIMEMHTKCNHTTQNSSSAFKNKIK